MESTLAPDVVVAGVAVVDIIGRPIEPGRLPRAGGLKMIDSVTLTTGGHVSNVGIDLAKLGFSVAAVTRLGHDEPGEFLLRQYRQYGMSTDSIIEDREAQTSSTIVIVARNGERTFLHTRGCLRNMRADDFRSGLPLISRARLLSFGYLGLVPEMETDLPALFSSVRAQGVKVLLDTAGEPRKNHALLRRLLPHVDYFLPSLGEARRLTGKREPKGILDVFRKAGARGTIGIKLGARGSCVECDGSVRFIPARKVRRVVDATGAGDAFVAGFIGATLRGYDAVAAAGVGNAVAAECVGAVGASTAIRAFEAYGIRTRLNSGER